MNFFNRFTFQTPENVELEFTLAGIGNRVFALLIDYLCLLAIQAFYLIALIIFPRLIADIFEQLFRGKENVEIWVFAFVSLILFFVYVGYFVFFETIWQGQTPGKRFVKIRVIRDDGRMVRLQQATLRALLRPVDDLFFLGIFFIVLGKREKRIGDWVAGTIVIQEERPIASANFSLSEGSEALAEQLQIEADISRLLPEDFAVIREYLQRREGMLPQARVDLSQKLARQIKEIIALQKVPQGTTPNLFLEAVYLAYQQQSFR